MPRNQAPAGLGISRIIAGALIAGVTTFALVAWFIVQEDGPLAADPDQRAAMFYAWVGLSAASAMAALVLWRMKVAPLLESPRPYDPAARGHDEALQTALIIVWALLEGPALFGVVVYLLFGSDTALAGGLLLVWLGIGLSFPRARWFPRPGIRGPH